jgi:internalin A
VTDAGLKELAGLKGLTRLSLSRTGVTDAGLKELAGLKNLKNLSLSGTSVTDAGAKTLQKALPDCAISP